MLTRRRLSWSAALLLTSGALLATAQSPAPLPSDLDPQSRARLPYLQRKDLDENAQKIFDVLPGRSRDGVDAKVIDVIRNRGWLTGLDEKDAAVIHFGRQMFGDKRTDAATFARVKQLFGSKGAMDMVAVMNTYAVSGFYAMAVDEHMPPGRPDLR